MATARTIVILTNLPMARRRLGNARIADRAFGCRQPAKRSDEAPERGKPAGSVAPASELPAVVPARRRLSFVMFGGER